MNDLKSRKIGALWIKEAKKDGRKFLAGQIYPIGNNGKVYKILILKNSVKNKETQPDWEIFLDKSNDIDLTVQINKPKTEIPLGNKEELESESQLPDEVISQNEQAEEIEAQETEKPSGPPF